MKAYEYTFKTSYKIKNCLVCPFKTCTPIYEAINESMTNRLTGTVSIIRQITKCGLTNDILDYPMETDSFNTTCPLYRKMKEIEVES